MTNSPLITYNPLSQDNSGKRIHRMVSQSSADDKTRKTGCSFAVGFENNTLIVQHFHKGYMNG